MTFLTVENIYLAANWGVLPFWMLLIIAPNNNITKFLVHSVVAPLLLAAGYLFIAYQIYLDGNFFESFNLYLGLENLYTIYSDEKFLLVFWLHFLSISLFVGSWIARDSTRFMIPKFLSGLCLMLTYFTGPVGLLIYWFFRLFFSKKINFNE